jgi:hypothetical protein
MKKPMLLLIDVNTDNKNLLESMGFAVVYKTTTKFSSDDSNAIVVDGIGENLDMALEMALELDSKIIVFNQEGKNKDSVLYINDLNNQQQIEDFLFGIAWADYD